MAYEFKKLSDVNVIEAISTNTNVLVEENGEIVKVAANSIKSEDALTREDVSALALSGSWNDMVDRPFGENPTGGDTVEWDGNPAGHASGEVTVVDGDADNIQYYYKVSDAVPTQEELQNGATLYSTIMYSYTPNPRVSSYEFGSEAFENAYASGIYFNSYGVVIVTEGYENKEVIVSDALGDTGVSFKCIFPEKGIYFIREDVVDFETGYTRFTSGLKINNYTGFPTSVLLDTEYLPSTVPVLQVANVGDVVVVAGVDENGKPTQWTNAKIPDVPPMVVMQTMVLETDGEPSSYQSFPEIKGMEQVWFAFNIDNKTAVPIIEASVGLSSNKVRTALASAELLSDGRVEIFTELSQKTGVHIYWDTDNNVNIEEEV